MLLRKLMSHLKRQDWFAVGIDFLIVVFGVFFGFQVTDWNQARQDRALERGYITRISHDIARSRDQIAASNDAMRIQADGATLVSSTLDQSTQRFSLFEKTGVRADEATPASVGIMRGFSDRDPHGARAS